MLQATEQSCTNSSGTSVGDSLSTVDDVQLSGIFDSGDAGPKSIRPGIESCSTQQFVILPATCSFKDA